MAHQRPKTSNALFGDLFGQRADYSNGMFYAGHRKYLNPRGVSALEPPNEFLSKRQISQLRLSRQGTGTMDEKMSFHVNFQNKRIETHEESEGQKKLKKVVHLIHDTISFEHFSSVRPEDWMEEEQAGVKFWVNKMTGEASSNCPWKEVEIPVRRKNSIENKAIEAMRRRTSVLRKKGFYDFDEDEPAFNTDDVAEGTGSLVYDGRELEDLFAMLNANGKSKK